MRNLKTFDLEYVCPDLKTQSDEASLREALDSEPGIEDVDIDIATHRVRIVAAGDDGERKTRLVLEKAGFPPAD